VLAALNNDTSHANKMIEEFEMQLRILQDEELLEKWSEYISWTQQHFISSNNESLNLMKRCVKHFKNKTEFRSHEKFVKIWIKISEMTIEAEDIFMYMFQQEIGTSSALLYKEWARHHEIVENFKRAEEIYTLGINRDADPVEDLKQLRSQFDWRQIKKKMTRGSDDEDEGEEKKPEEVHGRKPLNKLPATKSGKVNSRRERVKLQDITSSHGIGPSTVSNNNRKCSSASVFEILDDRNIQKKESTLPSSTFPSTTTGKSSKLPFHNNKENLLAVERMNNNKIKSTKPATLPPSSSKPSFFIYRDDESTASNITEEIPSGSSDDVFSSVTIVSRKPLNSITSQVLESNDMLQDLEQDCADSKAVCVYPKDKVYMGNSEVSMEELKMNKYKGPQPSTKT